MRSLAALLLIVVTSCATKTTAVVSEETPYLPPKEQWVDGELTRLETVARTSTKVAFLSGVTLGVRDTAQVRPDTLPGVNVRVIRPGGFPDNVEEVAGGTANGSGKFQVWLSAGTYDVLLTHPGYGTIVLRNVVMDAGEHKMADATLGVGGGSAAYEVGADNSFTRAVGGE
ncbi:MAG: carboxypeptidase-like regulatory domain-containing protein [Catalinimonas sp.]